MDHEYDIWRKEQVRNADTWAAIVAGRPPSRLTLASACKLVIVGCFGAACCLLLIAL